MRKKILVIDDDVSSLELLEDRLKASGYDVITASDGQVGLAMVRSQRPDLVILDVLLPRMNGFQLCQRIKEDPALSSIPIMMLTAVYVDEADKEKGLQVGAERYLMKADVYMSKPFLSDRLLDNVRVLLGERKPEEVLLKEKILVIDDDPAILELLQVRLGAEGYEVVTALDGKKGLKMIDSEEPNMVILDIQLPRMSGMDVLTKIREDKPHLPVVMITAYGSEKTAIESMRKGANDYITKPIDHEELSMRIRENLEKSRLRREKERLISTLKESNVRMMHQYEKIEGTYNQLRTTQEKLVQSEKLASVGRLGAGVAHELNNPLGIIFMNIQRLAQKMAEERANLPADKAGMIGWESYQRAIERIKKASLRSQRIINSLLSFSRISEPKFSSTNINRVLDEIFSLVEHQVSLENIKIIKKYDPHLPKVLGDPSQLKQVFINLILNARQAMLQGGKLYITTKKKRNSIEAEVRDTGCGIPKKDIGKIFDPFFSSSKKGTGLGLFVSHGIIEHHHGSIEIKSEKGKGTSVIIHLPLRYSSKKNLKR